MAQIVSEDIFNSALREICASPFLGVDTETTGLRPFHGDRMFSTIISTPEEDFYFNFNDKPDHLGEYAPIILERGRVPLLITPNHSHRILMANPVFDTTMLEFDGLDLITMGHKIYAVEALARIQFNDRFKVSLDWLARDLKLKKIDTIKNYCTEHGLYSDFIVPGTKTKKKNYHFDKVPFPMMAEYGAMDGNITVRLGMHYMKSIMAQDQAHPGPNSLGSIIETERDLVPVLHRMRKKGIRIDVPYCLEAQEYYRKECERIAKEYLDLTGLEFTDSNTKHAAAFDSLDLLYPRNEKGNPTFAKDILEAMETPIAKLIKDYRTAYKKVGFFASYIYEADEHGYVHASLNQANARTARFSSSGPNLQQVPKRGEEDSKFPVRRAFIPSPGKVFVMMDFDQFEYRMMLNKAGEMGVINQVLGGLDVHDATKNEMEIDDRNKAKTINFLLLYGGGLAVMALRLFKSHLPEYILKKIQELHFGKWSQEEREWINKFSNDQIVEILQIKREDVDHGIEILNKAKALRETYFTKLPKVKDYVKGATKRAESGKIYNEFGGCYTFRSKSKAYSS